MAKTYWNKIKDLEDVIAHNNSDELHKFIDILAQNELLTEHMLSALCEATHSQHGRDKAWGLLHEFAASRP